MSPHSIRHTTAVHLLSVGVDINTIRTWLGHVSLDTTHVYAEVDMEMKEGAGQRRHLRTVGAPTPCQCVALVDDLPEGPAAAIAQ
ncbi:tyrosine-type recombinase/integrase [Bradyrhizobium sp. DASA03068]|uniref:tyrosine-type recombinase/integrase n=1 Tax=Bradyrhizobium sp. BLXBL-01 TaxID=3395915 RepID=UPI003F6EFAD0